MKQVRYLRIQHLKLIEGEKTPSNIKLKGKYI